MKPAFRVFDDKYAIIRMEPGSRVDESLNTGGFFSVTCTPDEVSVICRQTDDLSGLFPSIAADRKLIMLKGPLDMTETGIISGVTHCLAIAGIAVFTISTFDTDYFLVEEKDLGRTLEELEDNGYEPFNL